jgi:hypothetical protein
MLHSVTADRATVEAAHRAACDGRDRLLLLAQGDNGGTMTYGKVFASDGALSDEADMLRQMGQQARLFVLTARVGGETSIEPLAA